MKQNQTKYINVTQLLCICISNIQNLIFIKIVFFLWMRRYIYDNIYDRLLVLKFGFWVWYFYCLSVNMLFLLPIRRLLPISSAWKTEQFSAETVTFLCTQQTLAFRTTRGSSSPAFKSASNPPYRFRRPQRSNLRKQDLPSHPRSAPSRARQPCLIPGSWTKLTRTNSPKMEEWARSDRFSEALQWPQA